MNTTSMIRTLNRYLISIVQIEEDALSATHRMNHQRLYVLSFVSIPISVVHILAFLFFREVSGPMEELWRNGIILAHASLVIMMVSFGLLSNSMRSEFENSGPIFRLLPTVAAVAFMAVGVAIVTIDQWVTPSITPFLVACTITGLVFLLHPIVSIPLYLSAYVAFFFSLPLTQKDPAILLSNQVNGITAIGIGICLSVIMWKHNVRNLHQQRELERMNEELDYLASYDSMTGLLNRRQFEKIASQELVPRQKNREPGFLLIADIDLFKEVNDKYGHPCGDEVLRQFAELLRTHIRPTDVVARWGGEEFIVLLPGTGSTEATAIAERLRDVTAKTPFEVEGQSVHVTISVGGAVAPLNPEALSQSYSQADEALYLAKEQGRNRVIMTGLGQ